MPGRYIDKRIENIMTIMVVLGIIVLFLALLRI